MNLGKLKISPLVSVFNKDGVYAFYHHLTLKKFYCNESVKKLIDNLNAEKLSKRNLKLIELLYRNNFLVDKNFDKEKFIKDIWRRNYTKPRINVLYLLLTNGCNFKCKYCFIENALSKNSENKIEYMDKNTARKAIDLFIRYTYKNFKNRRIFFYGGEPLLNKKVFKFAVKYLREKEKLPGFKSSQVISVNTNGHFIDKRMAKFLSKYNVNVSLSLDGWKELHDEMRIYPDGSGTFDNVIKALKILKRHKVTVGVSCTIGKHNVDYLPEIVKYFHKLGIKGIGFNILTDIPDGENPASVNIKKVSKKLIEAYLETIKLGIFEDRIGKRRAKAFLGRKDPFERLCWLW